MHPLLVLAAFTLAAVVTHVAVVAALHVVAPDPVRREDIVDDRASGPTPPASGAPLPPWAASGHLVERVGRTPSTTPVIGP